MDIKFKCWKVIRGDESVIVRTHPTNQVDEKYIERGVVAIRPNRSLFQEATRIFPSQTILITLQTCDDLINSFEISEQI